MSEHDALTSTAPVQEAEQQKNTTHAEAFSFGDPIPVPTAANCWTMWNAYRWIDGMNHR